MTASTQNPVHLLPSDTGRTLDPARFPSSVQSGVDARSRTPIDTGMVERVRGEFLEMPGLSPTLAQASRLFALSAGECEQVLDVLLASGFLKLGRDGQYRLV